MKSQKNKFTLLPGLALILALTFHISPGYAERADRDQTIRLEAAQVSIDDAKQVSTFEGNVQLVQGTLTIRGDKLLVTQDKNGLKQGTATGKLASFRQKREGLDEYVEGFGERIEYDTKSETVDFFGQARMQRGRDEVRGEHITYNAKTEIFQALGTASKDEGRESGAVGKGRVHVIIQPKSKSAPAAAGEESLPIKPSDSVTQPESNQ